jgi:AAA domain, putative AbiEii toxin, Type IV TA system/AAA ATPase domain
MRIERLKLSNYKSFDESPELLFTAGFNVIAGQNNTGKTALLEALSLLFNPIPHRSLKTLPTRVASVDPVSVARVSVTLGREELMSILAAMGPSYQHQIALPKFETSLASSLIPPYLSNDLQNVKNLIDYVLSLEQQTFTASLKRGGSEWSDFSLPSNGLYQAQRQGPNVTPWGLFQIDHEQKPTSSGSTSGILATDFGIGALSRVPSRIFRFSAERLNIGACKFGSQTDLAQNAANLPEVLNSLQQNPVRFLEFNRLVHRILPQVQQVTVRPTVDLVQIIVWPHDPKSEREDLAIPLDQCGTGIGQVLAILYVAMHAPFPRVILIDEPQSFLHPGAARKLIEVLSKYPQHQFIITTHSPAVINAADPETIIVTRLENGVSKIEQIPLHDNQALHSFLSEIGGKPSDVFGADNVLWVEGRTEEICFPLILRGIAKKPYAGTAIVGVRSTGDFEMKDATRIFEIHNKLATGGTLIPPALAYIFDSECRTPQRLKDITRISQRVGCFLEPQDVRKLSTESPGYCTSCVRNRRIPNWRRVSRHGECCNRSKAS